MFKPARPFKDRFERRYERLSAVDPARKTLGRERELDNDIIGEERRLVIGIEAQHAFTQEIEEISGRTRGRIE
jgi:hypothetical protein